MAQASAVRPCSATRKRGRARIAQGMDVLKEHAIKGYQGSAGYMPAKGGRTDLSDEEVANAVEYMVSESQ